MSGDRAAVIVERSAVGWAPGRRAPGRPTREEPTIRAQRKGPPSSGSLCFLLQVSGVVTGSCRRTRAPAARKSSWSSMTRFALGVVSWSAWSCASFARLSQ